MRALILEILSPLGRALAVFFLCKKIFGFGTSLQSRLCTYNSMDTFYDESVCSAERLLKPECSSIDFEDDQRSLRISPKKGLWVRIWQYRLSFLVHLAIISVYTIDFCLILKLVAKQSNKGSDLVNCELTYWPSYVVACWSRPPVAPAQNVMRFEKKFINNDVNRTSPFKGMPRPEPDDAWESLFACA